MTCLDSQWLADANRLSDWSRVYAVVAGLGASGYSAADALLELGAKVCVVDGGNCEANQEKATILETLGAEVRLGADQIRALPQGANLVIASPGWRPDQPMLAQAEAEGIPIWGDIELAWRMMQPDRQIPWLGVTGTNGKTTTTQMVESILAADGRKTCAVGNIGRPIIEAILDEEDYDVLAVELSSFQLHWCHTVSLHSAAVLNLHQDHLEWYACYRDPMAAYGADKARIFHLVQKACVYNVADEATMHMVEDADVVEGARAIGFTRGIPSVSMIGVVDDQIVDRAFISQRQTSALPLCSVDDVQPNAPHNIENALAAAALTQSFGVSARAVRDGLRQLSLGGHRIETVAQSQGITWVDDSKATNPHAANASMGAFDSIVWIAGGQAKGTSFDELVTNHASRLRAVIVLGEDRHMIAAAVHRHAPRVRVEVIDKSDTSAMADAVEAAARYARPGDTVLLAPGCASKDMWSGYDKRGDDFATAARAVASAAQTRTD